MPLDPVERVSVRRHTGYPVAGAAPSDALAAKLAGLTLDEEVVILDRFLPVLDDLEMAIPAAGKSLDTAQAAVWKRNPLELAERINLYRSERLALCYFLGIEPGPGIPPLPIVTDPGGGSGGEPPAPLYPPAVFVV